jgi:hypothetical protein
VTVLLLVEQVSSFLFEALSTVTNAVKKCAQRSLPAAACRGIKKRAIPLFSHTTVLAILVTRIFKAIRKNNSTTVQITQCILINAAYPCATSIALYTQRRLSSWGVLQGYPAGCLPGCPPRCHFRGDPHHFIYLSKTVLLNCTAESLRINVVLCNDDGRAFFRHRVHSCREAQNMADRCWLCLQASVANCACSDCGTTACSADHQARGIFKKSKFFI